MIKSKLKIIIMKKVSVLITTVYLPILFGGLVFAGELVIKTYTQI